MTNLTPGVQNAMHCDSVDGLCTGSGAGHGLLALQARVTAATPSKWRDGIVRSAAADGWVSIAPLDSDELVWVWHHRDLSDALLPGSPVALHSLYHALAIGSERINVLVAIA
ncbi:MAG TPA: hypothetical protein VGP24_15805 [Glaciihabitans sp.]|jgi:hypothetical protein|nr:hypothetical protein [Glaciihabitans sp.]